MPSREILDKLFEVERRAEALVAEAQDEAMRRASRAKEIADEDFKRAYEEAVRRLETRRSEIRAEIDRECRAALDGYRDRLGSVRLDTASFGKSCDSCIARLF